MAFDCHEALGQTIAGITTLTKHPGELNRWHSEPNGKLLARLSRGGSVCRALIPLKGIRDSGAECLRAAAAQRPLTGRAKRGWSGKHSLLLAAVNPDRV